MCHDAIFGHDLDMQKGGTDRQTDKKKKKQREGIKR